MIRFALTLAVLLSASLPARAAVDIKEVTSPGGLSAWLVEEHSIPFTALEIRFKGGALSGCRRQTRRDQPDDRADRRRGRRHGRASLRKGARVSCRKLRV